MICIFCLCTDTNLIPWVPDNPGKGCQYGLMHEFPEKVVSVAAKPTEKKLPKNLCLKCGLHPKNPLSATNECEHQYQEV